MRVLERYSWDDHYTYHDSRDTKYSIVQEADEEPGDQIYPIDGFSLYFDHNIFVNL